MLKIHHIETAREALNVVFQLIGGQCLLTTLVVGDVMQLLQRCFKFLNRIVHRDVLKN